MKNRYIIISIFALAGMIVSSCGKDFLELTPKGTNLEDNYYKNESQVFTGVVAIYDALGKEIENSKYACRIGMLNSASDDCFAGGGSASDIPDWQVWSNYTLDPGQGPQAQWWDRSYKGIYRANVLLAKIDKASGIPASNKARYIAEAKFLRAYFYFDLVRLFRNIPLILTPLSASDMYSVTQVTPEEVYTQIEKDLKEAIPDLPESVPVAENGRVTKFAAMGYLGRVILTQNDESRMLEAAQLFNAINTAPNYALLGDYASIFRPDNKFNSESIFEIVHTSLANEWWGNYSNLSEGNVLVQMIGPRSYNGPVYKPGYGFNILTPKLVGLLKNDPRYNYTVLNMDSLKTAGYASYSASYQNTGYFMKKYAPLIEFYSTGGGDLVLNYPYDMIELRLADTYLMEAEALVRGGGDVTRAQFCIDQVRNRVGLPSVSPTLDNIYKERQLELATEGIRYFDLIRTGKAATELNFKGFTPNRNEVLPIPLGELVNTKLVQNPEYR